MRTLSILILSLLIAQETHARRLYGVTEIGTPEITASFFATPPASDMATSAGSRSKSVAMTSPGVVEVGEPDINVPFVKTSGVEKNLSEALKAIVPPDWHAQKKSGVDRYLKLSWNKGMDWVRVLNDIAIEYRLAISIDWDNNTVTILEQFHDVITPPTYEPTLASGSDNIGPGKVFTVSEEKWAELKKQQTKDKNLPSVPVSTMKKYESPMNAIAAPSTAPATTQPIAYEPPLLLVKGEMMHKSFEQWVTKSGWNLVWDAKVDYVIPVNATFSGSVEEIAIAFENSARAGGLSLHIEGKRLNRTIQVTDSH